MNWQDISTAPKDGTPMLLSNGQTVQQGWWMHDEGGIVEIRDQYGRYIDQDERESYIGWWDHGGGMQPEPTHWMPLPAAPDAVLEESKAMAVSGDRVGALKHYRAGKGCSLEEARDAIYPSESAQGQLTAALERMDALLVPANGLLTVSDTSATVVASRADMALIRAALAAKESP